MKSKLLGKKVIVRTESAGVFAGVLDMKQKKEARVVEARRLWYWSGAASLSQLAVEGVKDPKNCKFPCKVPFVELTGVNEILPLSDAAWKSIEAVPVWEK